jgi:hypothetical protein
MLSTLPISAQTGTPATQPQKPPPSPCKTTPEYRQFDFWVGEWAPQNKSGKTVGTSSIQLMLGDCVIFENWNTSVVSGKSFSIYDSTDHKWHQSWVTDHGVRTEYEGGLVDGKMVLVAKTTTGGKETLQRMTYSRLENGNVRQYGDTSTDGGKTWTPSFDFTYVKKPQ